MSQAYCPSCCLQMARRRSQNFCAFVNTDSLLNVRYSFYQTNRSWKILEGGFHRKYRAILFATKLHPISAVNILYSRREAVIIVLFMLIRYSTHKSA